jgi:hypothetical protein
MMTVSRVLAGIGVALVGSVVALLVGSPTIARCLGPLGVTPVRCAYHGGQLPTAGAAGALIVLAVGGGVLLAIGARPGRLAVITAVVAGAVGALGYLATRPTVLEGPDYDGTWLSLELPIEPWALVSWIAAGAVAVVVVVSAGSALRSAMLARRRDTARLGGDAPPKSVLGR